MSMSMSMSMSPDARSLRACITGIGTVTPFVEATRGGWADVAAAIARGTPAYERWSDELNPPFPGARFGLVRNFPKERFFSDRQLRMMDKAMSLSCVAAAFAFEDSGLWSGGDMVERDEIATVLASAQAEAASLFRFGKPIFQPEPGNVNPAQFPMIARNVACGQLAIRFGLRGWSTMIASGAAGGAHALARAVDLVTTGRARTVVVGAFEVLSQLTLNQWTKRRSQQSEAAVVPDRAATDWVPIEAACMFVVESLAHAAERGRRPYALIEHCAHGYSQGERGQGWSALLDRFLGRHPSPAELRGGSHVSCASRFDGGVSHQGAIDAFGSAIAQVCGVRQPLLTRADFGDAQSVNTVFGVAVGCRQLSVDPSPEVRRCLVSSLNHNGSYALFSLQSAPTEN